MGKLSFLVGVERFSESFQAPDLSVCGRGLLFLLDKEPKYADEGDDGTEKFP